VEYGDGRQGDEEIDSFPVKNVRQSSCPFASGKPAQSLGNLSNNGRERQFSSRFPLVDALWARFDNRCHIAAIVETTGCARANRRADDWQQRCRFALSGLISSVSNMSSSCSISSMMCSTSIEQPTSLPFDPSRLRTRGLSIGFRGRFVRCQSIRQHPPAA
jgi:hypothetical protein